MPSAYFGPSPDLLPPGHMPPPDYLAMQKSSRSTAKAAAATRRVSSGQAPSQGPIEYKSVFQPRPGQEHVCGLSTGHRTKVDGSEWALLDTLDVQMCNDDRERREALAHTRAAEQRGHLDRQVGQSSSSSHRSSVVPPSSTVLYLDPHTFTSSSSRQAAATGDKSYLISPPSPTSTISSSPTP